MIIKMRFISGEELITGLAIILLLILIACPVFSILAYSYSDTTFGGAENRYEDIYVANGIIPPHNELKRIDAEDFFADIPNATEDMLFGLKNSKNVPIGKVTLGTYSVYLFDNKDYVHAIETNRENIREYDIIPLTVAENVRPVVNRETGDIIEGLSKGYKIERLNLKIPNENNDSGAFIDYITVHSDDKTDVFGYEIIKYNIEGCFYGNYAGNLINVLDKSTTENAFGVLIKKSIKSISGPGTMAGEVSLEEEYLIPSIPFCPVFTTQSKVMAGPYGDVSWWSHSGDFMTPSFGIIGHFAYLFAFYVCAIRIYRFFWKGEKKKPDEN